jgi:uncharacterized protein (TIGR03086 family)
MTSGGTTAVVTTAGVALLERALAYTLGGLLLVTPEAMGNATPCRDWDLRALLLHMNESLLALHEAIAVGRVDLSCADAPGSPHADYGDPVADPVGTLRNRGCQLIGAWANAHDPADIEIADRGLTAAIVAATGAVEVAVHGWDVARACGQDHPVPATLAAELLDLSRLFVREGDRPSRFAARLDDSLDLASPSERLVAFLGRRP